MGQWLAEGRLCDLLANTVLGNGLVIGHARDLFSYGEGLLGSPSISLLQLQCQEALAPAVIADDFPLDTQCFGNGLPAHRKGKIDTQLAACLQEDQ